MSKKSERFDSMKELTSELGYQKTLLLLVKVIRQDMINSDYKELYEKYIKLINKCVFKMYQKMGD